jgi:hypothetical protein
MPPHGDEFSRTLIATGAQLWNAKPTYVGSVRRAGELV